MTVRHEAVTASWKDDNGKMTPHLRDNVEKTFGADVKFFSDGRVQPMAGGKRT